MGGPNSAIGLMFLVLVITLFCSLSITNAASRTTWAFARDDAIPGAKLWAKVNQRFGVPVYALGLTTIVQMLLGLINLGSTSAFTAFVSVGVQALALSYALPISLSLFTGRQEVNRARWTLGPVLGKIVNVIALCWIAFELVLFSMPTALPVTPATMNYASVVLVGFGTIAAAWYAVHSRKGMAMFLSNLCSPRLVLTLSSIQRTTSFRRPVIVSVCGLAGSGRARTYMHQCCFEELFGIHCLTLRLIDRFSNLLYLRTELRQRLRDDVQLRTIFQFD